MLTNIKASVSDVMHRRVLMDYPTHGLLDSAQIKPDLEDSPQLAVSLHQFQISGGLLGNQPMRNIRNNAFGEQNSN